MSFLRNKKRLRPRSPSASACAYGESIQGRCNMKKYFSWKCCQTVEILEGNYRFRPVWGEHMKKRGSKYEHFASGTLARGAMRGWFLQKEFFNKNRHSCRTMIFPENHPEVSGSGRRLIRTYFQTCLIDFDWKSPRHIHYKIHIKIPIHFYFNFCLRYRIATMSGGERAWGGYGGFCQEIGLDSP